MGGGEVRGEVEVPPPNGVIDSEKGGQGDSSWGCFLHLFSLCFC